ncbi:hypothetical protein BXZ70DRAFT_770811 [Cristinia sonorae]|uniref:C2H2-type domain-containing protein n=1 Tax=Cristinia sonorae TaxID=1940300 RepID=A0A8K0USU4_9AGAR|nr:hypothetical protein BXZ70DRAFT_770811 [Cristinia sonorae]
MVGVEVVQNWTPTQGGDQKVEATPSSDNGDANSPLNITLGAHEPPESGLALRFVPVYQQDGVRQSPSLQLQLGLVPRPPTKIDRPKVPSSMLCSFEASPGGLQPHFVTEDLSLSSVPGTAENQTRQPTEGLQSDQGKPTMNMRTSKRPHPLRQPFSHMGNDSLPPSSVMPPSLATSHDLDFQELSLEATYLPAAPRILATPCLRLVRVGEAGEAESTRTDPPCRPWSETQTDWMNVDEATSTQEATTHALIPSSLELNSVDPDAYSQDLRLGASLVDHIAPPADALSSCGDLAFAINYVLENDPSDAGLSSSDLSRPLLSSSSSSTPPSFSQDDTQHHGFPPPQYAHQMSSESHSQNHNMLPWSAQPISNSQSVYTTMAPVQFTPIREEPPHANEITPTFYTFPISYFVPSPQQDPNFPRPYPTPLYPIPAQQMPVPYPWVPFSYPPCRPDEDIWTNAIAAAKQFTHKKKRQRKQAGIRGQGNTATAPAFAGTGGVDGLMCMFCMRTFSLENSLALHIKSHRDRAYRTIEEVLKEAAREEARAAREELAMRNASIDPSVLTKQPPKKRGRKPKYKTNASIHSTPTSQLGFTTAPPSELSPAPELVLPDRLQVQANRANEPVVGPITPLATPPRGSGERSAVHSTLFWRDSPEARRRRTTTGGSSQWGAELFGSDN